MSLVRKSSQAMYKAGGTPPTPGTGRVMATRAEEEEFSRAISATRRWNRVWSRCLEGKDHVRCRKSSQKEIAASDLKKSPAQTRGRRGIRTTYPFMLDPTLHFGKEFDS